MVASALQVPGSPSAKLPNQVTSAESEAEEEADTLMPLELSDSEMARRASQRLADEHGVSSRGLERRGSRRPSTVSNMSMAAEAMMSHVKSKKQSVETLQPGKIVNKKTVKVNLLVVRNARNWTHNNEDGGAGKPGIVSAVDPGGNTCTVYWYQSGEVHSHYSIGANSVLCMPTGAIPEALGGKDGMASPSMASSALVALRRLFGGKKAPEKKAEAEVVIQRKDRRSSQHAFADRDQTIIMFDWDDTLFPTTFLRHDLGLSVRKHLKNQNLKPDSLAQIENCLARSAGHVDRLLRLADTCGKVVIVTLAKSPWVTDSCKYFYPGIGELIEKLNIKIVYAQEGKQVEYNKVNMMAEEQFEEFWAEMKGKAIAEALQEFYSQYEGQSWKNIISLGDSDFERYGAMAATLQYAQVQGLVKPDGKKTRPEPKAAGKRSSLQSDDSALSVKDVKTKLHHTDGDALLLAGEVNGHDFKVRTKTFKMLDDPTVEELIAELGLLHQWLPMMVRLDEAFNVDLNSLEDNEQIKKIEATLQP
jgi:hypothetical protein